MRRVSAFTLCLQCIGAALLAALAGGIIGSALCGAEHSLRAAEVLPPFVAGGAIAGPLVMLVSAALRRA